MKNHRLFGPLECPSCGVTLDGAWNTTSDAGPADGDATLCVYCRALLVYRGSPVNSLRHPTKEEEQKFLADPGVQRAIAAVAAMHRNNPIT